ncbi:hypothetical protein OG875_05050 [Streptomyces sp. NBC_01498]|uniref:hypothetical protein n=1 Tax=Streptomyces sp. NBC_01498 TaxID=2975870 RepID=UPI002E7C4FCA|nr:hypothetical protein [Streptomyces sp. NBC_01498]WTL24025.1 hypothetical protein OG875_05050 [Streptomyces sp. NBC_01498]
MHARQINEPAHDALATSASPAARCPATPHNTAPANNNNPNQNPEPTIANPTTPATIAPANFASTSSGWAYARFNGESDGSDFQ